MLRGGGAFLSLQFARLFGIEPASPKTSHAQMCKQFQPSSRKRKNREARGLEIVAVKTSNSVSSGFRNSSNQFTPSRDRRRVKFFKRPLASVLL